MNRAILPNECAGSRLSVSFVDQLPWLASTALDAVRLDEPDGHADAEGVLQFFDRRFGIIEWHDAHAHQAVINTTENGHVTIVCPTRAQTKLR